MPTISKLFCTFFILFFCNSIHVSVYSQNVTFCKIDKIKYDEHNKTRRSTILRELEFSESDIVRIADIPILLEDAQQNLMNTLLFNFVTVKPLWNADSTKLDVEIEVIEKWYIWPIPLLEIADRNLNAWWKDKDLSRLNYGMFLNWDNFTGRKDMLKVLLRFGHEDKLGLFYALPSFNKKQNLGFDFGISYAQKHEIGVKSVANELVYFRDEESYIYESFVSFFRVTYRPQIHHKQYVKFEYHNINLADTIVTSYPTITQNNLAQLKFFKLSYKYTVDYRDYIPYPLTGYYFDVELNKVGLGLIQSKGVDFFYVKSNLNFYWKLRNRWFYGASLLAKISNAKYQPYILQKGLGYKNDFIRSYELYVMDGQHYGLLRSNLKYELLPKRVHNFKFINNEKFSKIFYSVYLNLFFDFGYVNDKYNDNLNPLVNEIQYGYGIGLDYVTYYDIVFRIEYSMNKQNESFVFFHVQAPF